MKNTGGRKPRKAFGDGFRGFLFYAKAQDWLDKRWDIRNNKENIFSLARAGGQPKSSRSIRRIRVKKYFVFKKGYHERAEWL
jgi:hypothetical protein